MKLIFFKTKNIFFKIIFFILIFFTISSTYLWAIEESLSTDLKIPFMTVGDEGNEPDENGLGNVPYRFQIGKFDINATQYCAFLNRVATKADPHHLFNPCMELDGNVATIQKEHTVAPNGKINFSYHVMEDNSSPRENLPMPYVSWASAARFCNWLENHMPYGNEDDSSTEKGTYNMSLIPDEIEITHFFFDEPPSMLALFYPTPGAHYRLPTLDEIYKATYYKGGSLNAGYWKYPTQSNTHPENYRGNKRNQMNYSYQRSDFKLWSQRSNPNPPYTTPVGSFTANASPYGCYDLGGNLKQWTQNLKMYDSSEFTLQETREKEDISYYQQYQTQFLLFGQSWYSAAGEFFEESGTDEDYTGKLDYLRIPIFKKDLKEWVPMNQAEATIGFRIVHINI